MEQIASQNLVIEFANSILLFVSWKLVIVYVFVFLRPHVLHLFYPSYCSHTHFSHTRPPLCRSPPSSPTLFNLSQSPLSSPTLSQHYSRTPPPSLSPHSPSHSLSSCLLWLKHWPTPATMLWSDKLLEYTSRTVYFPKKRMPNFSFGKDGSSLMQVPGTR